MTGGESRGAMKTVIQIIFGDGVGGERTITWIRTVGISNLIFLCSQQVVRVGIAFAEPDVSLENPKPPPQVFHFLIRTYESIFRFRDICVICVWFSHIICPTCLGSLLPVPPAPPPVSPPLPHVPSILLSTRSSSGAPQAQMVPIFKCLICLKWLNTPKADVKHNKCVRMSTEMWNTVP